MSNTDKSQKSDIKNRKREFPVGRLGAHVKNGVSPTFNQYFRERAERAAMAAKA